MSITAVPIGQAARQSGVKVPTIRYYEQIGLLPAPPRSEGNRRQYDADDLRRLAFIRHARELGFETDAIRALLALQDEPDQSCASADQIARARAGRGGTAHRQPDSPEGRASTHGDKLFAWPGGSVSGHRGACRSVPTPTLLTAQKGSLLSG
jgi:DNA-binding transcriptional MerR regulator